MRDQRTQPRQGPGKASSQSAPVWVLVLGAALLGLALLLTALGPRQFEPVATRTVGAAPVASGN
jgi:hypothetical protein